MKNIRTSSVFYIICLVLLLALALSGCMEDGLSAYELALKNGTTTAKSEAEWLESLKGADGRDGEDGTDGKDGKSAYQLALEAGYSGTLEQWLESLRGKDGKDGAAGSSAYEIAKANGYTGSESEWVAELLGSRDESGTGSGVGIASVQVNSSKHLIVRLTNGTVIDAGYVGVSGGESATPGTSDTVDADGYTVVNQTVKVIAGALNIRSSPTSASAANVVGTANQGEELTRIGIGRGDNTWSKVMYGGQICYASSKYLEVQYDAEIDMTGVEIPRVNLADEYKLLTGVQTWFEVDQFVVGLADDMYTSFEYSGSGAKLITESAIAITPSVAETATLRFNIKKYIDGNLTVIYSKTVKLTSVKPGTAKVSGLVVGDSRIADGTLVDSLKSRFGSSLTLLGTLKTGSGNPHEGRGSWSVTNYLSYAQAVGSKNPFYNSAKGKFDFEYYLKSNNYTAPDFVLFYLGANDGYSSLSVLNYAEIVNSIKAYNTASGKQVKVLIMQEYLAPREGFGVSYNFDAAERRDEQFEYFIKLTGAFGGRESEGIYLIPANVPINAAEDRIRAGGSSLITDVIHLSKSGYTKQADMISAYIYSVFSVK